MFGSISDNNGISAWYKERVVHNEGFPELIDLMRESDRKILDVGCGAGGNARLMKKCGKSVYGITLSEAEAKVVAPIVDQVVVGNIETMQLDYPAEFFDGIVLSHVLEHLLDPLSVLIRLKKILRPGGRVYVALPNICFYKERIKITLGRFRYADDGIIDRLHLRFFTFETTQELVQNGGYKIMSAKAIGGVPLWPLRRLVGNHTCFDRLGCALFPNLFGFHIIVIGELKMH